MNKKFITVYSVRDDLPEIMKLIQKRLEKNFKFCLDWNELFDEQEIGKMLIEYRDGALIKNEEIDPLIFKTFTLINSLNIRGMMLRDIKDGKIVLASNYIYHTLGIATIFNNHNSLMQRNAEQNLINLLEKTYFQSEKHLTFLIVDQSVINDASKKSELQKYFLKKAHQYKWNILNNIPSPSKSNDEIQRIIFGQILKIFENPTLF